MRSDPAWTGTWRQRVSEGRRKLAEEQVRAIAVQQGKSTATELAERYGVSRSSV